jgi:TRAP-type mannitol/chloroaromatic compound transport system permease large subunit
MKTLPLVVMFGTFFVLMVLAVPISFAIGISSMATLMMMFPLHQALVVTAQKTASGFDSFTILSLLFFILAGAVMNSGGIARRLINLAKVIGAPLPGSLLHTTILGNMMFGALSGSAVASAAAVGGVMAPLNLYYAAFLTVLALVTIFPEISLFLPRVVLGYGG